MDQSREALVGIVIGNGKDQGPVQIDIKSISQDTGNTTVQLLLSNIKNNVRMAFVLPIINTDFSRLSKVEIEENDMISPSSSTSKRSLEIPKKDKAIKRRRSNIKTELDVKIEEVDKITVPDLDSKECISTRISGRKNKGQNSKLELSD